LHHRIISIYHPEAQRKDHILAILLVLSWQPVIASVRLGQFSIAVAVLVTLFWPLARENNLVSAALCLALACSMKLYPLLFFPFLFLVWRRALVLSASFYLGGLASCLLFMSPAALLDYLKTANAISSGYSLGAVNVSLLARVNELALATVPKLQPLLRIVAAVVFLAAALIFWFMRTSRRRFTSMNLDPGISWDADVAIVCCLCCLLSPVAWTHYFAILLLPCVLLLTGNQIHRRSDPDAGAWAGRMLILLLLSVSDRLVWGLQGMLTTRTSLLAAMLLSAFPTYALAALVLALVDQTRARTWKAESRVGLVSTPNF
jgi:hypothetical protein